MPRILHIVGCKNAGKTRAIEVLVPPLRQLGMAVGTLKYTEHDGFDWDVSGKDTYRHRQAGSDITGIFGRRCYAFADNRPKSRRILISHLIGTFYAEMDIVLVEGYRLDGARKLEVLRPSFTDHPVADPEQLLATYGERLFVYEVPHFEYGKESELARHIFAHLDDLVSIAGSPGNSE